MDFAARGWPLCSEEILFCGIPNSRIHLRPLRSLGALRVSCARPAAVGQSCSRFKLRPAMLIDKLDKLDTIRSKFPVTFSAIRWAVVFTIWVALGRLATNGQNLARIGLSFWEVVSLYFGSAIFIGLSADTVLRPLTETRFRSAILGFLVTIPIVLIFMFTVSPYRVHGIWIVYCVVGLGLLSGVPAGAILWRKPKR